MFEFFISPNCIRDYKLTRKLNSDMRSFDKWMHHCREIIEEELKKEWKGHNIDRRYRKKLLGHIRCKCSFKIKLKGTQWHKVPGGFFLFVIFSLILTSFYPDIWIYLRFHPFPIKMAELFLLAKCQWTANANIYNIIMQLWYKTIIKIPCYFFFACYYHIHKIFFFYPGGGG